MTTTTTKKEDARLHSYVVRTGSEPPLTITAESFAIDKDTITFSTGGHVSAVVRGGWASVVQTPDPAGA